MNINLYNCVREVNEVKLVIKGNNSLKIAGKKDSGYKI